MSSAHPTLKLDELIALNDEIAALVRAGIPLELGLQSISPDLRGSLAIIVERIAVAMSRGASLPEAIGDEDTGLPKVYRAVVNAGLMAGQLSAALECISAFARTLGDMRRRIAMALIYPAIVLILAYALFLGFIAVLVPRLLGAYDDFRLPLQGSLKLLQHLQRTMLYWGPVFPALVVLSVVGWIALRSNTFRLPRRSANSLSGFEWIGPFGWLPWSRRIVHNYELANFADLLALLTKHNTPLPDAVLLAAEATSDARIVRDATRIAEQLRNGLPLNQALGDCQALPSFLKWILTAGEGQGALSSALEQAGELYRRRALSQAEWFKLLFPVAVALIVGGGATLMYALTLFLPLTQFLQDLQQ